MAPTATAARRAIPLPPRRLLPALGGAAAVDGLTGLVILSAGNSYLLNTLAAAAALPAVAITLQGLVKITASPLAGRLTDRRVGAALPAVPLLAGAGLAAMLFARSVGGYLLGLTALAAATSTAWVILRHEIGDATTESERGGAATWVSLASGAGTAGGFAVGTVLAGISPRSAFATGLVLAVLATLLLRSAHRARLPRTGGLGEGAGVASRGGIRSATIAIIAAGQFVLAGGLLVAFWPFVIRDIEVDGLRLAALLVPAGLLTPAGLLAVARWSRPGRRAAEAALLHSILAAGLLLAALAPGRVAFAAAMAAVIPALAAGAPVVTAAVIDYARQQRGSAGALGWLASAEAAGMLAGSACTGVAVATVDARGAFAVLAVLAGSLATMTTLSRRVTGDAAGVPAA